MLKKILFSILLLIIILLGVFYYIGHKKGFLTSLVSTEISGYYKPDTAFSEVSTEKWAGSRYLPINPEAKEKIGEFSVTVYKQKDANQAQTWISQRAGLSAATTYDLDGKKIVYQFYNNNDEIDKSKGIEFRWIQDIYAFELKIRGKFNQELDKDFLISEGKKITPIIINHNKNL